MRATVFGRGGGSTEVPVLQQAIFGRLGPTSRAGVHRQMRAPQGCTVDKWFNLVHSGENRCMMTKPEGKKRFTISLDASDYDALRVLADGHRPPISLQYVLNVAVKDLLEKHATRQLDLPLDN